MKQVEKLGFRTEMKQDYTYKFQFAKTSEKIVPEGGQDANKVSIGYTQNHPYIRVQRGGRTLLSLRFR